MPKYSDASREQVRDAVDFVDLVGQRTELRRAGAGRFEGLCPFHDERSPSFGIEPQSKLYHCFGCGAGGDLFTFVQETEGFDFTTALEWLADRYGVQLEPEEVDPREAERRKRADRLHELLDRTAAFYERNLWESAEAAGARDYLASRGLALEALKRYRVGYAPSRWDAVLLPSRRAGYSEQELLDAGVAQRSKDGRQIMDRFRRRIMFPLADRRGKVMGFGARALSPDQKPKYLNSNDSGVFKKGRNVYGADVARSAATKAGTVVLCEGYTDVIALHQVGVDNAVCSMGTALTDDQVTELSRLAPTVVLALDADSAGQEAMLRAARVAAGRRLELRVARLPEGKDPADVALEPGGAEAVGAALEASVPFVAFRVRRELERAALGSAEGVDKVIEALRPVFADLPPSALREDLIGKVADATQLKPSLVAGWLSSGRPQGRQEPQRRAPSGGGGSNGGGGGGGNGASSHPATPPAALGQLAKAERTFLTACTSTPRGAPEALEQLGSDEHFLLDVHRRVATRMRAASGKRLEPTGEDPEADALVAELVVGAAVMQPNPRQLEAQGLLLRLARLEHEMEARRRAGTGTTSELARQRQQLQHQIPAVLEAAAAFEQARDR